MNENLGQQFRWVPDQSLRWKIKNHIMDWHMKGQGEQKMKTVVAGGMTDEDLHNLHMEYHKNEEFEEGKEHKHFTPKDRK